MKPHKVTRSMGIRKAPRGGCMVLATQIVLLFIFILIVLFSGCKKEATTESGKVTFYTYQASGHWTLILDGQEYYSLQHATQMPVCGDPKFSNFWLKEGKHTVDSRSLDGFAWGHVKTINVVGGGCITVQLP